VWIAADFLIKITWPGQFEAITKWSAFEQPRKCNSSCITSDQMRGIINQTAKEIVEVVLVGVEARFQGLRG
jgi:hypothetical protein